MTCDSSCSTHCSLYRPLDLINPSEELVSSNDVPSSLQATAISFAIERARADLARVQDALAILSAQRAELEDFIRKNSAVVSSLRRLPNEMLSEIFLRCVDPTDAFDPVHNDPWVLARVCQRWRLVAVTTSKLWCHIVLPKPDYRQGPHPIIPHRLLETQLERAHLAPLTICLNRFVGYAPELLDVLFAVAHQWREVDLGNGEDFPRFVELGIEFPFLETLVVDKDASFGALLPSNIPGTDLVKSLPALKHLTLSLGERPFPPQLRLPWAQLRTYNLCDFTISHIREVLPLLSPGTHLTLRLSDVDHSEPTPIITNIHSLELMGGFYTAINTILNLLVAPLLKRLLLTHGKLQGATNADAVTTFLNNSGCTLHHLRVLRCMTHELVDLLLLPAVRDIRRLDIWYLRATEWTFLFSEFDCPERRLVPGLRTLVVRVDDDLSHHNISRLLASRNPVQRVFKIPVGDWECKFRDRRLKPGRLDLVILWEAQTTR